MKVLFDHSGRFSLQQGGFQIQIEETKRALEAAGVEVDFLRWWDSQQRGDVIHFFGLPNPELIDMAHKKGVRVVITHLLGGLAARAGWKRMLQTLVVRGAQKAWPTAALARLGWTTWKSADAFVAVTSWEAHLMKTVFGVTEERIHIVPNGVANVFFKNSTQQRGSWLVTTASIFPVKRVLETARAAVVADVPYWVIGRPLAEAEEYYREFSSLCQQNPKILRHDNSMRPHSDLVGIYQEARGFVLLSRWETQSLSALEAAATECPLLLSDLPWARATFGDTARYCELGPTARSARCLREFYDAAPKLPAPAKPARWSDVAKQLQRIYTALCG